MDGGILQARNVSFMFCRDRVVPEKLDGLARRKFEEDFQIPDSVNLLLLDLLKKVELLHSRELPPHVAKLLN